MKNPSHPRPGVVTAPLPCVFPSFPLQIPIAIGDGDGDGGSEVTLPQAGCLSRTANPGGMDGRGRNKGSVFSTAACAKLFLSRSRSVTHPHPTRAPESRVKFRDLPFQGGSRQVCFLFPSKDRAVSNPSRLQSSGGWLGEALVSLFSFRTALVGRQIIDIQALPSGCLGRGLLPRPSRKLIG